MMLLIKIHGIFLVNPFLDKMQVFCCKQLLYNSNIILTLFIVLISDLIFYNILRTIQSQVDH